MMFMIKRGDQEFGPYSGTDIRQYLSSGNIVESDLVRAEGSDRWLTVQEILGGKAAQPQPSAPAPAPQPSYTPEPTPTPAPMFDPAPSPQPYGESSSPGFGTGTGQSFGGDQGFGGAAPVAASWGSPEPAAQQFGAAASGGDGTMKNGAPLPPNLNWIIVLVACLVCGIFGPVWLFLQAQWVKKLDPQSNAPRNIIAVFAGYFVMFLLVFAGAFMSAMGDTMAIVGLIITSVGWLLMLGLVVFLIMTIFGMKTSLEGYFNAVEPINLKLNPILVFFFAIFYFQYQFNRIHTWKTTGTLPQ